jgi:hypothetical protein
LLIPPSSDDSLANFPICPIAFPTSSYVIPKSTLSNWSLAAVGCSFAPSGLGTSGAGGVGVGAGVGVGVVVGGTVAGGVVAGGVVVPGAGGVAVLGAGVTGVIASLGLVVVVSLVHPERMMVRAATAIISWRKDNLLPFVKIVGMQFRRLEI